MPINADKPRLWKADTARSVDFYNEWFMRFAPEAYRSQRVEAAGRVESALERTANLTDVSASVFRSYPDTLTMLRMATAPPIARDRLAGLACVSRGLVKTLEEGRLPVRARPESLEAGLDKLGEVIERLVDEGIFPWIGERREPAEAEVRRAATVVADRLCGTRADPIIRNAQEQR
ncbi:MAG: XamI family restriction endonuclease, partial [Rubrobacteraceae bacterium]